MWNDVTLIEVPYWWDRSKETLAATIHVARPELVAAPPGVQPIPTSSPEGTELLELPLSHGQPWVGDQDVMGWLAHLYYADNEGGCQRKWMASEDIGMGSN